MSVDKSSTPASMATQAATAPHINTNHDIASVQPTIRVTKRHDRSTLMFLLQHLIKPFSSRLISSSTEHPAGSPQLTPHAQARKRCDVRERKVEDIYLYDLTPKDRKTGVTKDRSISVTEEKKRKRRIYYYSGGGWQMPASSEHWYFVAELAQQLHPHGFAITLVSYPLAPNSAAPISFPAMLKQYRTLMETAQNEDEDVILAGDSAGGNIVLALVISALLEDAEERTARPTAKAVMAISPSTDLRRSNPDMHTIASKDPILKIPFVKSTAEKWCGNWPPTDIRVSPLHSSVDVLKTRGVKVHGVTGGYDILGPDAILMREKLSQAGVEGEWLDWDKQMHVFPLIFRYGLREGREGKDWILDVLRRC
ncbi:hypothetical protein CB0940_09114 [Cercospora beticola]|uniref:Alpha/beta hydrolase fold-3 domain-containing protein n=1 Tax=Cercospora beticola TaxID=122368 RepID=A0A2G5HGY3_CERBT|nr:hypothetical protein CB0940_09114 [Cercospora beticola]PIA91503.1 hypothetical protein CB0940_09114 [Cercospora beticola]WPB06603.1 hypothetical protein RHO25_011260 [Cercospora beticola]